MDFGWSKAEIGRKMANGRLLFLALFSVAISWGSKMTFSLCANMLGFCSDSHKLQLDFKYHYSPIMAIIAV